MQIKIKKIHPGAKMPEKAHNTDTGFDLFAIDDGNKARALNGEIRHIEYKTGIQIEPPKGYHTELFPRSSISNYDLSLCNGVGLVDESYRGELILRFRITSNISPRLYKKGEKIAQLVLRKTEIAEIIEVNELENTDRGEKGFGSTGN